jgi:ribosomal protein L16 Arg81 hydroxylase
MKAGDMMYIPAGVPHLPANLSDQPCTAIIARTDPSEQESMVLLPDLDALAKQPHGHFLTSPRNSPSASWMNSTAGS